MSNGWGHLVNPVQMVFPNHLTSKNVKYVRYVCKKAFQCKMPDGLGNIGASSSHICHAEGFPDPCHKTGM